MSSKGRIANGFATEPFYRIFEHFVQTRYFFRVDVYNLPDMEQLLSNHSN